MIHCCCNSPLIQFGKNPDKIDYCVFAEEINIAQHFVDVLCTVPVLFLYICLSFFFQQIRPGYSKQAFFEIYIYRRVTCCFILFSRCTSS